MPEGRTFKFAVSGERCAPVGAAIKALADEHGWWLVASEFCLTVEDYIERGEAKKRNKEIMHVWLAVEMERYHRKKGIAPALKEAWPARSDRQWWAFVSDDDKKGFNKVNTARRWHWKGQQLMMKDEKIAKEWNRNLESAKWCVDNWTVEKAKALMDRLIKKGGPKAARKD